MTNDEKQKHYVFKVKSRKKNIEIQKNSYSSNEM